MQGFSLLTHIWNAFFKAGLRCPLGTRKQLIPQKNDMNIFFFNQLASFSSRGNSHTGPGLENRVDGTQQLLFHLQETMSQWEPCSKEHYQGEASHTCPFLDRCFWKQDELFLTLLLLNTTCIVLANSVDPDQLASSEANWSGSALFVIKYVNFYHKPRSSNLLAGNYKWARHLNLFSIRRVNTLSL